MLRNFVIAGLVAAGLTGMVTSTSQAAVLPAGGALATETGVATPVHYYGYGYNQPYYYHRYHRPHYRYYGYHRDYGNYYYRPHRLHRWWRRW